jgi:hexosaminidase
MANGHQPDFNNLLIPVKTILRRKGEFSAPPEQIWPAKFILAGTKIGAGLEGVPPSIADKMPATPPLQIVRDKTITNPEAYRIIITPNGIEVWAGADAGAYYALQTLRDMIKIYDRILPACRIEDEPDFRRRGVYLDCSRGKVPSLHTLKELVAWLAHWKINELQLYIENVFTFKHHPEIGKGYSPLTPEEILDLQDFCRKHHVRLVGSLASFGHIEKILTLPQYRHLGEMQGFHHASSTLCPLDPGSIKLMTELYNEFLPLFDADNFNVCCDETWELGKGRSKRRAEQIGVGRIYLDFLLKIYHLCRRHEKRMNVWADILLKYPELLEKLPRDIVLLNWEYEQDGKNIARTKEIAEAGMTFMVCPGTSSWQTHGSRLPNSMGNVTNFAKYGRKYKAEGLLNTDWGDFGHRNLLGVSLHGFAHGAAHAWNGKAVDNDKFTNNFCFHVFGQKTSHMAEALRLLGNTYITCGKTLPNKSLLYHALVEPLLPDKIDPQSPIELMTTDGLKQVLADLSEAKLWPKPDKILSEFERLALKELALAARMDCLASRRALIGKTLRSGKSVRTTKLKKLGEQMHELSEDFKELWLLRNKPSRLRDNLNLFQKTRKESERLALYCSDPVPFWYRAGSELAGKK